MKITSWRNWLRKHFGRYLRPARPRTLAKSACVALGLATAWGGEAKADITFQVSITPAHDLLDAFVYYGNNATGPTVLPLGELEGGKTYELFHTLSPDDQLPPRIFDEVYRPGSGHQALGYAVAGLYESEGEKGILVSFPEDSLVVNQVAWEEFAGFVPGATVLDEVELVAKYFDLRWGEQLGPQWLTDIYYSYTHYYYRYSEREEPYVTPYDTETNLVAFGNTRFAGTAIVSIVPEPGTTGLLVLALVGGFGFIATQGRVS